MGSPTFCAASKNFLAEALSAPPTLLKNLNAASSWFFDNSTSTISSLAVETRWWQTQILNTFTFPAQTGQNWLSVQFMPISYVLLLFHCLPCRHYRRGKFTSLVTNWIQLLLIKFSFISQTFTFRLSIRRAGRGQGILWPHNIDCFYHLSRTLGKQGWGKLRRHFKELSDHLSERRGKMKGELQMHVTELNYHLLTTLAWVRGREEDELMVYKYLYVAIQTSQKRILHFTYENCSENS